VIRKVLAFPGWLVGLVLIALVRFYQVCLRPFLPAVCRFHPSCSQYFILAVRKYGPLYGAWKGVRRICRCHPWNPGGYDPP
jgi:putative membrane protein insertion efficiency factor